MNHAGAKSPLRILYFLLRERVGVAEEDIALPQDIGDVGALSCLARTLACHASAVRGAYRALRVNQDFAAPDTPIIR